MKKTVYIIRHAERREDHANFVSNDEPITKNGSLQSEKIGHQFSQFKDLEIYSSPILRCIQTATSIAFHHKNAVEIIPNSLLGDPGAFIINPNDAKIAFENYGNLGVIEKILQRKSLPGFLCVEQGSEKILNFCKSLKNSHTLMITHDSILAFLAASIFKTNQLKDVLYDYLDGIVIEFVDDKTYFHQHFCLNDALNNLCE